MAVFLVNQCTFSKLPNISNDQQTSPAITQNGASQNTSNMNANGVGIGLSSSNICGLKFDSLLELIHHIEDNHINDVEYQGISGPFYNGHLHHQLLHHHHQQSHQQQHIQQQIYSENQRMQNIINGHWLPTSCILRIFNSTHKPPQLKQEPLVGGDNSNSTGSPAPMFQQHATPPLQHPQQSMTPQPCQAPMTIAKGMMNTALMSPHPHLTGTPPGQPLTPQMHQPVQQPSPMQQAVLAAQIPQSLPQPMPQSLAQPMPQVSQYQIHQISQAAPQAMQPGVPITNPPISGVQAYPTLQLQPTAVMAPSAPNVVYQQAQPPPPPTLQQAPQQAPQPQLQPPPVQMQPQLQPPVQLQPQPQLQPQLAIQQQTQPPPPPPQTQQPPATPSSQPQSQPNQTQQPPPSTGKQTSTEKPFKCNECGRKYKTPRNFEAHMTSHQKADAPKKS